MRVLQIHKFFYPHAGSETVLLGTRELLSKHGHDVIDFGMKDPRNITSPYSEYFTKARSYTDTERSKLDRGRDAVAAVYSFDARRQLRALLQHTRPDVAHMHIVYHQLTLSVVDELVRWGIPSVLTLHDYKIACPAYTLFRDGKPCDKCTRAPVENVARHKCIKGSRPASVLAAAEARLARVRGSYDKIDGYVAPSAFAGDVAHRAGIGRERIHLVPNFLGENEWADPVTTLADEPTFFFAGRLEDVKGVRQLLRVFQGGGPELGSLVIAGAGGELEGMVSEAARAAENIQYCGRLTREEVRQQLRGSRALLLPSRWHENNPMSVLEARASGIPVIVSDMGGLPEMVEHTQDGFIVGSDDDEALAHAIKALAADRRAAEAMGRHGHETARTTNTPDAHYPRLMGAYDAAIEQHASFR